MKSQKHQSGFSVIEALLIVFVVAALAITSLVVYQRHKSTSSKSSAATTPNQTPTQSQNAVSQSAQADTYEGWQTYTSNDGAFSIKYPPTWKFNTSGNHSPAIISPTNTVLYVYADQGGKGGSCPVQPGDVPFRKGNRCPTIEYLSSEKLAVNNLYFMDEVPNVDPVKFVPKLAPVYLVTTHFDDARGNASYGISIAETTTPQNTFGVNTPYMGAVMPFTFLTVFDSNGKSVGAPNIYVYANGDSQLFLTSADGEMIKTIIRSFRLNI